jgi:hypothetical protein
MNGAADRDFPLPLTPGAAPPFGAPSAIYLSGDDAIRLTALNAASGVTLTLVGRHLALDGRVQPFIHTLTPATDRSASTRTQSLAEGWLLQAQVFASSGAPQTGQTFVVLSIVRGLDTSGFELATLAAGYVTARQRIAWPSSPVMNSLEGHGARRVITGTAPAAGAEIAETVPTGATWLLKMLVATLTTSATVANRFPNLLIDGGGSAAFISDPPAALAASQARNYTAGGGTTRLGIVSNADMWAFPTDVLLGAGSRWRTSTNNIQVGDQWAAPIYVVEEWLEG